MTKNVKLSAARGDAHPPEGLAAAASRTRGMEAIGCQRTATAPQSAAGAPAEAVSPEQAVVVICASRNQAERLVSEIAAATRARDLLTAQREELMAKVKAKFEQQLTACENEIKTK